MIFCAAITDAFLPRAKVLAESVKRHHPDSRFIAGYLEKAIHPEAALCPYFDDIVLAKNWGHPHFDRIVFSHPVYIAQCALRPAFLKYMLHAYPGEKIVCLGADTKLYSPLQELEAALDQHPMVLTTHRVEVNYDPWYMTVSMYNGDLLAFRAGEEAHRYTDWMSDRMMRYCYIDIERSLFLDQTWLKFAPVFFHSHALMHPGYNVAFWNTEESGRQLFLGDDGVYRIANGDGLRFFHFSNLSLLKEEAQRLSNPALNRLYEEYMEELAKAGGDPGTPWSYDFFDSGEPISPDARGAYGSSPYLQMVYPAPYHSTNEGLMQTLASQPVEEAPANKARGRKAARPVRRLSLPKRKLRIGLTKRRSPLIRRDKSRGSQVRKVKQRRSARRKTA